MSIYPHSSLLLAGTQSLNECNKAWLWITADSPETVKAERFFVFSVLHNALQKILWMYFLERMSGDNLQPLHQCLILFQRDLQCLFFCTGPAETAKLQCFVKEKKSVSFPYKPFDAVTASATEEKKNILFIRILLEVKLHNGSQTIDPAP